jgi:hypothetical protein
MTIRHVPEEWRSELAVRAARQGQSLQEFMLGQIGNLVAHPPLEMVLDRARTRARASGARVTIEDTLEARDADRR